MFRSWFQTFCSKGVPWGDRGRVKFFLSPFRYSNSSFWAFFKRGWYFSFGGILLVFSGSIFNFKIASEEDIIIMSAHSVGVYMEYISSAIVFPSSKGMYFKDSFYVVIALLGGVVWGGSLFFSMKLGFPLREKRYFKV